MAKPPFIQLPQEYRIPILFEDRSVLAIDKPAGWMLVPVSWQKTGRNLQAALLSSIAAGHFWARSRNIRFLRNIHRLDAETSGVLLFARSIGALNTFSGLFETRQMEKIYLAVTRNDPGQEAWTCRSSIGPDPHQIGRMQIDPAGKEAETAFQIIARLPSGKCLIEARPWTGRTHQIRIHLVASGCPIGGDPLYGTEDSEPMGLRAIGLAYKDPFTRKPVRIRAPFDSFLAEHGFPPGDYSPRFHLKSK